MANNNEKRFTIVSFPALGSGWSGSENTYTCCINHDFLTILLFSFLDKY